MNFNGNFESKKDCIENVVSIELINEIKNYMVNHLKLLSPLVDIILKLMRDLPLIGIMEKNKLIMLIDIYGDKKYFEDDKEEIETINQYLDLKAGLWNDKYVYCCNSKLVFKIPRLIHNKTLPGYINFKCGNMIKNTNSVNYEGKITELIGCKHKKDMKVFRSQFINDRLFCICKSGEKSIRGLWLNGDKWYATRKIVNSHFMHFQYRTDYREHIHLSGGKIRHKNKNKNINKNPNTVLFLIAYASEIDLYTIGSHKITIDRFPSIPDCIYNYTIGKIRDNYLLIGGLKYDNEIKDVIELNTVYFCPIIYSLLSKNKQTYEEEKLEKEKRKWKQLPCLNIPRSYPLCTTIDDRFVVVMGGNRYIKEDRYKLDLFTEHKNFVKECEILDMNNLNDGWKIFTYINAVSSHNTMLMPLIL